MRYLSLGILLLCSLVVFAGGAVYFYGQSREATDRAADARAELARVRAGEAELRTRLSRADEEFAKLTEELACVAAAAEDIAGESRLGDAELLEVRKQWEEAKLRVQSLEADLRAEIAQRKSVDEFIERTSKALAEERARHNKEIWQARQFMPEGLRVALRTVNELLALDGRGGMRFLRASKIEDDLLHKVQMLDRDAMTLGSTIYIADEVSFDVDRVRGSVTLCFRGGYARGPHGREEFPIAGKQVRLDDVDCRAWEDRLPFLVTAHGEYPVQDAAARVAPMDRARRLAWKGRINSMLGAAKTDLDYRIDTFEGIRDGELTEALFLGYDDSKRLATSVEAQSLWIQVNDRSGTVEVWMRSGIIRRKGGETAIPSAGYRIQLPGLKPKQALDAMLGMVKRK